MNSEAVVVDVNAGLMSITLNHPKVNALTLSMVADLRQAIQQASKDSQVRCVLLTGAGPAFSAGQDVNEMRQAQGESFRHHLLQTYNPLVLELRRLEKPVLAAVNGTVAGAALGLALACDLRIASDEARFVVGFLGLGLALDSAVSLFLPATIGLGRAAEVTFTNTPISAAQALAWGLVNRVVPAAELGAQATAWAAQVALGPVQAMGLAKRAFNKALYPHLEAVLDYEAHLQEVASHGWEHQEGLQAFLEKRLPRFIKD